jgi:hypothetical protein
MLPEIKTKRRAIVLAFTAPAGEACCMKKPRKGKADKQWSFFYDPLLPERELMMLVLYEITRLKADVRTLVTLALLEKKAVVRFQEIHEFAEKEAFEEFEKDKAQFMTRKQIPSGN